MKIALQIGLPFLVGAFITLTTGWLLAIAFGLHFAPAVVFAMGGLALLFALIGFGVVEGHWAWRICWGVIVGVAGFVGATLVFTATAKSAWGVVATGVPFGVVAALISRNVWATAGGALAVFVGWLALPAPTYGKFVDLWSGLQF